MDFWAAGISDLMSFGIPVSEAAEDVLTSGGDVLALVEVPPAGEEYLGASGAMVDQDGDRVFAAMIMASYPVTLRPTRELAHRYITGATTGATIADILDHEHGESWRRWPSYTGFFKEKIPSIEGFPGPEDLCVFRIWSCIPLAECGRSHAQRIVDACETRLEESAYPDVTRMIELLEAGYPEQVGTGADPDELMEYADIRRRLIAADLWDTEYDHPNGGNIIFPTMRTKLAYHPDTYFWWRTLLANSRQGHGAALAMIAPPARSAYVQEEREFDPWFSSSEV